MPPLVDRLAGGERGRVGGDVENPGGDADHRDREQGEDAADDEQQLAADSPRGGAGVAGCAASSEQRVLRALPARALSGVGVFGRVVVDDAFDQELVRDHHGAAVAGVDVGVGEGDVGDPPPGLFEADAVADPDRLRDRDLNAGDEVGEGVLGGEADDRRRATAVEARMPVASRFSSVNWLSASIARTRRTTRKSRRRRKRRRVRVERETCETAGDMEGNLAADAVAAPAPREFPSSNWGPGAAVLGAVAGDRRRARARVPGAVLRPQGEGDLTTAGNVVVQLGDGDRFPAGADRRSPRSVGAASLRESLRRLGVRRF